LKQAGEASQARDLPYAGVYAVVYFTALATALLTAFYTGRAFFLTFFGPEKLPSAADPEAEPGEHLPDSHAAHGHAHASHQPDHAHGHDQAHTHDHAHDHLAEAFGKEAPPVMTVPLILLAAGTVLVGLLFGPITHWFEHNLIEHTPFFASHLGHPEHAHGADWPTIFLGTGAALLGLAASWLLYASPSPVPARMARSLRPLYDASRQKFLVDELYEALVGRPTRALAAVSRFLDEYLVDGLVRLVAWIPRFIGRELLAPLQGGLVQLYAWTTVFGLVLLLLFLMFT
jgi:NADH-quinone oxidoreductase subunit L